MVGLFFERSARVQFAVLLLGYAILTTVSIQQGSSDDLMSRFQKEARDGWARLGRERFNYSYKYTRRSVYPAANFDSQTLAGRSFVPLQLKSGLGCMMLIATGPDGDEHVTAFNPQYRFTIVRYKGASDWKIEQIEPTSTPSYVYDITRYISSGINDMPQGETLEKKDSILELLGSTARNIDICAQTVAVFSPSAVLDVTKCTDFKPTSARWEVLDGRKVVAVEISWRLGKLPLQATIWCDPKVDWAVVKWHRPVSIMNMGAFTHTVEYEYDENAKMPIVKKVTTIGNDNGSIEETIFSEFSDKPFPARDFTLGAFGLPEPPGLSYRGGTWYVWISIGALAVILLMLWRRSTTMGKA